MHVLVGGRGALTSNNTAGALSLSALGLDIGAQRRAVCAWTGGWRHDMRHLTRDEYDTTHSPRQPGSAPLPAPDIRVLQMLTVFQIIENEEG